MSKPGLEITVRGNYFCPSSVGRGRALKTFKDEIFYLPETMIIQTGYERYVKLVDGRRILRTRPKKEKVSTRGYLKHIIRRLCLPARLKEKYEDFQKVREFKIEQVKRILKMPKSDELNLDPANLRKMSLSELTAFMFQEGIQVPIDSFADIDDARQAVLDEFEKVKKAEKDIPVTTEVVPPAKPFGDSPIEDESNFEEKTGEDGVVEEHYTDPSLRPRTVPTATDDLLG